MAKKDITNTGPMTWRDLQNQNTEALTGLSSDFKYMMDAVGSASTPKSLYDVESSAPQLVSSPLSGGETPWGQSAYDNKTANDYQFKHLGDIRANNQPWYIQAINGTLKGIGLAGTTFVDGTLGLATGIVEAISQGDFSRLWDNEVTQSMEALNKAMERELPNYYTEAEQTSPWYNNILSTNFIFDKFVKNLGFTVGAAYAGGVYTKILTGLVKGAGLVSGAVRGLTATNRATQSLGTLDKISRYAEVGKRAFDMNNGLRGTKMVLGSTMSAIAEGTVEAVSNTNDIVNLQNMELEDKSNKDKQALLEQYKYDTYMGVPEEEAYARFMSGVQEIDNAVAASKAKMEEDRKKMGTSILLANIPILAIDNYYMFGKMFAGGFKAARNNVNTVTRATKEAKREARAAWKSGDKSVKQNLNRVLEKAETKGYGALTEAEKALIEEAPKHLVGGKWKAFLANPLREGNEEMAQAMAAESAGLYYKPEADYIYDAAIHPESTKALADSTDRFWKAIGEGFENTYGNLNKWEEGFIGALTGAMGVPTFGKKNNSSSETWLGRNKSVGLTGGIMASLKEHREKAEREDDIIRNVNRILKDPTTVDRMKHVISQVTFDRDKKERARLNDKKGFKDSETAALFEEIMYMKRSNNLDKYLKMLQSIDEVSSEEIQEIVENTAKTISSKVNGIEEYNKRYQELTNEEENAVDIAQKSIQEYQEAIEANESPTVIKVLEQRADEASERLKQIREQKSIVEKYLNDSDFEKWSPYIHKDGSIFTEDEIRESLGKRTEKAKKLIDQISEVQDKLDLSTSEVLSDEQLATLTYFEIAKRDWQERSTNIIKSLKEDIEDTNALNVVANDIEALINTITRGLELDDSLSKKAKETIQTLRNIQKRISQLVANPEEAIDLLTYGKYTDKDGNIRDYGKDMLEIIEAGIKANKFLSKEDRDTKLQDIEDLNKIIDSYRTYDNLVAKYLANPGKIDEAHTISDKRATEATKKDLFKKMASEIDWAKPSTIKSVFSKYKDAISEAGGLNKFLASLDADKRESAKKALNDDDTLKIVDRAIGDSRETEKIKNLAKRVIKDSGISGEELLAASKGSTDNLDALIEAAAAKSVEEDGITDIVRREIEILNRAQAIKRALDEALVKSASKAAEMEKARQRELDEAIRKAAEKPVKDDGSPIISPEAAKERKTEPVIDENDPYIYEENKNRSEKEVKKVQTSRTSKVGLERQPRQKGYERRRQLTEYYIFGEFGQTLADFYRENPDQIPDGVKPEDFIDYLEKTVQYLKDKGAFTYVSGINKDHRLKPNDKLVFEVENELTHNGVKVVAIKTEDGQIVGTIRSQYEFDIYDASGEKNLAIEAQRELYKAVIAQHENGGEPITTTVESLQKGSLPVVDVDSTVASIFEGADMPVIGLVTGNNLSQLTIDTGGRIPSNKIALPDGFTLQRGQVYILIPTNTGVYIPAICHSTPIATLSDGDWYLENTISSFMDMISSSDNILKKKGDFVKWLPLKDFHIHIAKYNKEGKKPSEKWPDVATLDEASHITVSFTDTNGNPQTIRYKLFNDDGSRKTPAQIKQIARDFVKNTARKQELQTNIDKRRLSDVEYLNHMANYLTTNLQKGIGGQHSMNDGFLYVPTEIEAQYEARGKKFENTPKTTGGRGQSSVTTIVYNGKSYTLDMAGAVKDSEGNTIEGDLKEEILNSTKPKPKEEVKKTEKTESKLPVGTTQNIKVSIDSNGKISISQTEEGANAQLIRDSEGTIYLIPKSGDILNNQDLFLTDETEEHEIIVLPILDIDDNGAIKVKYSGGIGTRNVEFKDSEGNILSIGDKISYEGSTLTIIDTTELYNNGMTMVQLPIENTTITALDKDGNKVIIHRSDLNKVKKVNENESVSKPEQKKPLSMKSSFSQRGKRNSRPIPKKPVIGRRIEDKEDEEEDNEETLEKPSTEKKEDRELVLAKNTYNRIVKTISDKNPGKESDVKAMVDIYLDSKAEGKDFKLELEAIAYILDIKDFDYSLLDIMPNAAIVTIANSLNKEQEEAIYKSIEDTMNKFADNLSKIDYDNLSDEQQIALTAKGISKEEYESLAPQDKIPLIRCS